ncbi:MAG: HNH endonuclease [Phascolarctobacterium sp.]|nr:HNH endonuclease [Phascolarctobacterium sp.]
MKANIWTYDETLLAFELYCRTPFGKITERNPEIVELAFLLNRTPTSLKMKMYNLARLDPEEQARGVVSLKHGAKVEKQIWRDFEIDSESCILKVAQLKELLESKHGSKLSKTKEPEIFPMGVDRETIVKQRLGQSFFRNTILSAYGYKCCITGINIAKFLIASHIKPWRESTPQEKTNPRNGLCLNALHDKAFDQGYITINKDYKIIIAEKFKRSSYVDDVTRNFIIYKEGMEIVLPDKFKPNKEFIEYHNEMRFGKF